MANSQFYLPTTQRTLAFRQFPTNQVRRNQSMSETIQFPYLSGARNPQGICKWCKGPCPITRDYCKLRCRDAAHYARRKAQDNREIVAIAAGKPSTQEQPKAPWEPMYIEGAIEAMTYNPSLSPYWFEEVPKNHGYLAPPGFTFGWLPNGDAMLAIEKGDK